MNDPIHRWAAHVNWYLTVQDVCNRYGITTDGCQRPMLNVPACQPDRLRPVSMADALAFLSLDIQRVNN